MTNPLLSLGFEVPWAAVRADHVVPAIDELLADTEAKLDALERATPRTYDSTLGALERATERIELASRVIGHLEAVATTPELRAAWTAAKPKVSALWSSIPLREGLYRALTEFAATPDAAALDPARRRFLDKTIDEQRRHGAALPKEGKDRLRAIDVELSQLTTTFSQNVLDATNAFEIVVDGPVPGLPESALAAARASAKEKGKDGYRFTLQAPSITAVLTYADDAALREQAWRGHNKRGTEAPYDNRQIVARILDLRAEKAKLLGYATFADLVLADRMAKTGGKARAFVDDLAERTRPFFARENEELAAYRRSLEGPNAAPLQPWDVAYYAEKLRKAKYDFDDEELKAYFPADHVLRGVFETATRLYGVSFEPLASFSRWHERVEGYRILDHDTKHIGTFYIDLYPRETKQDGAWMRGVLSNVPPEPQLGLFCANVTPPLDGKPALLRHREVETLFHEFGHLMHHCLSQVPVRSLGGTQVAWDFVELPSQLMENWCWEREALDFIARHHETKAPIPGPLFDKMKKARTFRTANMQMRQLGFATVDLALHTEYDPKKHGDVLAYARGILTRFSPTPLPEDYGLITSFSHLFSSPVGYAAGYYSYKWAEVLEADVFGRFKREGIFNRNVGGELRDRILSKGDTADAMELFVAFMGREPRLESLLEREGLV